jgi:hypothetical protein
VSVHSPDRQPTGRGGWVPTWIGYVLTQRRQEVSMLRSLHRAHADNLPRDVDCCSDLQFPT